MADKRRRIPWARIGVDTIAVMLGVLAAFLLNDWREERGREALVKNAREGIRAEILANQEELERLLPYHDSLITALRTPPSQEKGISLGAFGIRNTAWETARAAGAPVYMDYRLVSIVSEIYAVQRAYTELLRTATQLLYTGNLRVSLSVQREGAGLQGYIPVLLDLRSLERRLLDKYEAALQLLES